MNYKEDNCYRLSEDERVFSANDFNTKIIIYIHTDLSTLASKTIKLLI